MPALISWTKTSAIRIGWLLIMGVLLVFGLRKITFAPDLKSALRWMDLSFTADQIRQMEGEAQRQKARLQSAREKSVDLLRPQTLVFRPWHDSVPSAIPDGFKWQPVQALKRPLVESDLEWLSVADLAAFLKGRLISSEALTRLALARLGRFDARLHCVVTRLDERALASARKADEEIRAGKWRGPLHGIPYGVKDILDVRGYPSTWGVALRSNTIATENATVVRRLDDAGAVLVAKLSLGELAMGDIWFGGKTRNPWSTNEGSSGSSAGSAASVAAGLLPFAIGSETLGSIVSPSTVCGVTGLRPTFGRIPRTGAMMLCPSLDKLGILARSAEDCALVFQVIRGPDGQDPSTVGAGFEWDNRTGISKLKIGILLEDLQKDLAGRSNHLSTINWMKATGANLTEVRLPNYPPEGLTLILMAEASASFEAWVRDGRTESLVQQDKESWPNQFRVARLIPAVDYLEANRGRGELAEAMERLLINYDAVLAPAWVGQTLLFSNFSGHPCVVFPNGPKKGSEPATVCLIGRWFGESSLLHIVRTYQSETRWHLSRPPGFE